MHVIQCLADGLSPRMAFIELVYKSSVLLSVSIVYSLSANKYGSISGITAL